MAPKHWYRKYRSPDIENQVIVSPHTNIPVSKCRTSKPYRTLKSQVPYRIHNVMGAFIDHVIYHLKKVRLFYIA